jgi:hypothetical protein
LLPIVSKFFAESMFLIRLNRLICQMCVLRAESA